MRDGSWIERLRAIVNVIRGSGARDDSVGGTVRTVRKVDDRSLRSLPHSGDAAGVGG